MAKYQFDELVKAAGSGEGFYDQLKKKEISEKEAIEDILQASFRFSITDGYLVEKGDTKSTTIQTNAYEREKYGPIKRLTRAELRFGDKFFRWVPEEDEDRPFKELYAALMTLRKAADEGMK